jgi:hypothetical protein
MTVFVLKGGETPVSMEPAEFDTEDEFQRLLADFPSLLAWEQNDGSPRQWLLLKREKSIPGEDGGGARWSVDHLLVDQDGVPTLVEVKRQSDTRLRREVVGQMLDYAANAVVYWPVDQLRAEFEADYSDPTEQIRSRLGSEVDPEALWQQVKTNLQAGRIRMLFVADRIPPELKRIVEFLNQQMKSAEVLALELRHFAGGGLKTIVPMVYGQTERAQQEKSVGNPKRQWDKESVLADLERRKGPEALRAAKRIAEWMKTRADQVWFGSGNQDGSMGITIVANGHNYYPIAIWSYGRIEIRFRYLLKGPFEREAKRRELLERLNTVDGVSLLADSITGQPSIPMSALSDEARLHSFLKVMDWLVEELKAG